MATEQNHNSGASEKEEREGTENEERRDHRFISKALLL